MSDILKNENEWDLVIKSQDSLWSLKLGDVWRYRDLLLLMVRRDFVSFYKQTILGPIWFFIQPIFTTLTFTIIFGRLAGISTDGLPQPLFYMVGITMWSYFSESLTKTSTVFRDNAGIFGKVYFPRLIIPLSIVVSNLIKFGVQLSLLAILMLYYSLTGNSFSPSVYLLLFPLLVILMAAQGLGLGMIITAMTNKYRDLSFLLGFGIQLLMYGTPVIYPLSSLPEPYRGYLSLNPMAQIIEIARLGLLGQGYFTWFNFGYTIVITLIILISGILVFNKVEKSFIDTV
ncbi:MAG: ABC transporter permease [Phormidesmis sp. FL-bin-119]|nr:ABC transporter permease [Pedobacter sp.]